MWDNVVRDLLTLRPVAVLTVILTLGAFLAASLCVRRLRVRGRGTRSAGLFVGLGGRCALLLAFAWVKFAVFSSTLLLGQPARAPHYLLLLCLGAGFLLLLPAWGSLLTEVGGGGLLTIGLALCAAMLDYLRQIRYDASIRAAYWLLAVFLILCAVSVLLREVTAISGVRSYFDEAGESE
ncbi:MAG: hypothetical protein EOM52_08600 [Clostridia bacterium]|nr:hypothetical protein [Clostridia bacterium]